MSPGMEVASKADAEKAKKAALQAMQAAGVGTWCWELPSGDFVFSGQAAALLEMAASPVSDKELLRLVHADQRNSLDQALLQLVRDSRALDIEFQSAASGKWLRMRGGVGSERRHAMGVLIEVAIEHKHVSIAAWPPSSTRQTTLSSQRHWKGSLRIGTVALKRSLAILPLR